MSSTVEFSAFGEIHSGKFSGDKNQKKFYSENPENMSKILVIKGKICYTYYVYLWVGAAMPILRYNCPKVVITQKACKIQIDRNS